MSTLTVTLGFNGGLRLLYPNGKSIDLPPGEAEARMVEILEGFRRSYREVKRDVLANAAITAISQAEVPITRKGFVRPARELTLRDLGIE